MKVQTIITVCVIGVIVIGVALYDAVTGDVSEWWESVHVEQCDCHCLHRVFED